MLNIPIQNSSYHPLSLSSFKCELFFNDTLLSSATCCLYKDGSTVYLVSNYHVLSGRNSFTDKSMDKNCAIPNKLRLYYFIRGSNENSIKSSEIHSIDYNLQDQNGIPLWLKCKSCNFIDIAVLKITEPKNIAVTYINIKPKFEYLDLIVGNDVYILGFPYGQERLPIWKKGSIASEPSFMHNYLEPNDNYLNYRILIDSATRPGMSGSPIFAISHILGGDMNQKDKPFYVFQEYSFIGIYSGRLQDTVSGSNDLSDIYFKAQIGVLWKDYLIKEIIDQK